MNTWLDDVIQSVCREVTTTESKNGYQHWKTLTEGDLLFDATVCIIGSQTIYELSVAIAEHLRNEGLVSPNVKPTLRWGNKIVNALGEKLEYSVGNDIKMARPRFPNRIANLIAGTLKNVYGKNKSFQNILREAQNPEDARRTLITCVSGFGPKQASLFLRRVGFSSNLAVIDTHILEFMKIRSGHELQRNLLGRIEDYERVESEFRCIADYLGFGVGCVDLAAWITMRVAKRGAYI